MSDLRLRPPSGFGFFGVVLMSCKVNFHIVRLALQNAVCLLSVYFCWSGLLPGGALPYITYTGMCRPTGS